MSGIKGFTAMENKRMTKLVMSSVIMTAGLLVSCTSDEPGETPMPRQDIELTEQTRAAASDLRDFYARFTTDMTEYVDASSGYVDKNVVVSPLSAAMVFAMAANGVDKELQEEYADYLGVKDMGSLNSLSRVLLDRLPEVDNMSVFSLANSVWVNKGMNLTLTPEYSSVVASEYNADIRYQDFREQKSTLDALNGWCASHTGNRITEHFRTVNPGSVAILLNALYFKGRWSEEIFDASRTVSDKFHGKKGDAEVMMMESDFYRGRYCDDGDFEYFRLYFGNYAFNLEIVLPTEENDGRKPTVCFDSDKLAELREESYETSVKAYLPRFEVKNQYDLDGMLESTGRSRLTSLNLSMFTTPASGAISYRQSAFFSVDENGAEAAAVTSGEIDIAPPITVEKAVVRVDRPFYFFISELSTGACILSGRIADL